MIGKIKDNYYYIRLKRAFMIIVPLAYTIYNGLLGILTKLVWNGSICIYYLLLFFIRAILIRFAGKKDKEKTIYILSFVFLLLINIALTIPAILMIKDEHIVTIGLIPSIAMAAYTTYNIVISVYNIKKYQTNYNILNKQLRVVAFVNAIASILVLQNILIVINGGYDRDMVILSTVTSFGLIALNVFVIIYSFIKNMRV